MKNKLSSLKAIFIKKMVYSAIIQFLVLGLILLLAKKYIHHHQFDAISTNLIINDSFTTEEIARYSLLKNKYALDLALFSLENERKLDSIKFLPSINQLSNLGSCQNFNSHSKICKTLDGHFAGITTITFDNKALGYILTKKHYDSILSLSTAYSLLLIFLAVAGVFILNIVFLFISIRKRIETNTNTLIKLIFSTPQNGSDFISNINIEEYNKIANEFIEEQNEIVKLQKEKSYYQARKNIAEQLAHDIRSPLAAINTAISDVVTIPEKKRIMIRNASKRINDIANNLLAQNKNNEIYNFDTNFKTSSELLFLVLDNIVSEKRYEYHKTKINIQLNVTEDAYKIFSDINSAIFKRIISNLINNSIDACKLNGSVIIQLEGDTHYAKIYIKDNGCGIPTEVLNKVTERGFSFNKAKGAGLGLYHAKKCIEMLNGKLHINSRINEGTTIIIHLPRSQAPNWFCDSLNLIYTSSIVILDDDEAIHDAWNDKLKNIANLKIYHFYKASDLTLQKINELENSLYLVDYELLSDDKNGLDVIVDLNLNQQAVLVSSCFEDEAIRERCQSIAIRILPKPYVPYVQIITDKKDPKNPLLVLIDDDEMIRLAWNMAAKEHGKNLVTYENFTDFIRNIDSYNKDSFIYIDSDLGNNQKGEICAKEIFNRGYKEIHLTTGYPLEKYGYMPWIKSIVGKIPPFLSDQE